MGQYECGVAFRLCRADAGLRRVEIILLKTDVALVVGLNKIKAKNL